MAQREFRGAVAEMLAWEKNGVGDLAPELPAGSVKADLKLHAGNPELA